jgi:hypothetical protein
MEGHGYEIRRHQEVDQMDHSAHIMDSPDIETLNYGMLKAPHLLPKDAPFAF